MEKVRAIARENERLFEQLISGERRYRSLAKAVWRVQEEERRRIARDLHDGIGQTLTALKNHLQRIQLVPARRGDGAVDADALDEALSLATQALEETRELSRLLRPPVLDDLGLEPALRWLARTVGERGGIEIETELHAGDGSEPATRFDPEVETLVFRVVQEGLTNALKHSGAQRARVALRRSADRLEVEVSDDGRGFDPERALAAGEHDATLGLRGMRDRAELFGGRLEVESSARAGARIRVILPLNGGAPGTPG